MTEESDRSELIHLEKENELRFTIREPGDKVTVQLIAGAAEIFGSELQINQQYKFSYFSSVSIFTWEGCTLKIAQETLFHIRYRINQSTQIPKMWDLHKYIEEMRVNADVNKSECYPITLLTGPTDVGKSTLCRYLLNSAAKRGRKSIFLDLDVGQSSLSITGTFAVLTVYEPSDVNGRFNEEALSVYFFGYKSPGHNMTLYKLLIEKIGRRLKSRLSVEKDSISGVLIDTCGWVDGPGYKFLEQIVQLLNVNMILVLSDSSLHSRLKHDVSPRVKILHVDNFSEVTVRNQTVRRDNRDRVVYQYFYGSTKRLKPYHVKIHFNDLQIYKASPTNNNGYGSKRDDSNVVSILIEPHILYQVLGLSYADHIENIPITSVYGFICIVEIDMNSKFATVLSPQPGPLPTKYFLMGDVSLSQLS